MSNDLPYVQPYAHIFFCEDIIKRPDGREIVVGQFRSHLLHITNPAPITISQLVVGIQLVIAKTDRLESILLSVKWRDRLLKEIQLTDEIAQFNAQLKFDPEIQRHAIFMDVKFHDIELDQDGDLLVEVLLNDEPLNHNALRFKFTTSKAADNNSPKVSVENQQSLPQSRPQPAIPSLVFVPEQAADSAALFAIATAYADAGLLISAHGETHDQVVFSFPAVVCSSFAIELFLKFFVLSSRTDEEVKAKKYPTGHSLTTLWDAVSPAHQRIIAGMYGHGGSGPYFTGIDLRLERFREALLQIGDSPFKKWRYAYEIDEMSMMSHRAIAQVLDALGFAAQYVRREPMP